MPLTQAQARDKYIVNNVAQFLTRNIKAAYDIEVETLTTSSLDISKSLKIMQGKPSDTSIVLNPPVIAIDTVSPGQAVVFDEIGTTMSWRQMAVALYCYPAINAVDGKPNDDAAYLLKAYMRDMLQTYSFKALDYTNPALTASNLVYCSDNIYIARFSAPIDRGKNSPNAAERNRFDVTLHLEYPVTEALVS